MNAIPHKKELSAKNWPVIFVALACLSTGLVGFSSAAQAQDDEDGIGALFQDDYLPPPGFLPQLSFALRLPERYQLRDPTPPTAPDEPIEYNRVFPIWGKS